MIEKEIKLNNESFGALLTGKKLEMIDIESRITIYPPHYGLYLTREQLEEIKLEAYRNGAKSLVELLGKIR